MNHIAEIKDIKETESGTWLKVYIPDKFLETQIERNKQGDKAYMELRLDDKRRITALQQKKYWATVNDIAKYTGHIPDQLSDYFKMLYRYMHEDISISMSSCTVTQARQMINILIEFAITRNVPLSDLGINRTDDVDRYLYLCLVNRVCTCCGAKADVHHVEKIGMGRDRTKIDHAGMKAIALCRKHHSEVHQIGEKAFVDKHKVYGLELDEYAVKKLKL